MVRAPQLVGHAVQQVIADAVMINLRQSMRPGGSANEAQLLQRAYQRKLSRLQARRAQQDTLLQRLTRDRHQLEHAPRVGRELRSAVLEHGLDAEQRSVGAGANTLEVTPQLA